jgi:hypothetical protein
VLPIRPAAHLRLGDVLEFTSLLYANAGLFSSLMLATADSEAKISVFM